MIIHLERFLEEERPYWNELEDLIGKMQRDVAYRPSIGEAKRLHYLYERASTDLAKLNTFASEPALRGYLETLVAQAYGELHEVRLRTHRFAPIHWFFQTFPQTFRRRIRAFWLAVSITLVGATFGAGALALDPGAKESLMPFPHLQGDPSDRVAAEEKEKDQADDRHGSRASFSAMLMTHNTRVSIFTMALGMTWGIGTTILLFYNGVILGAVALDYMRAGETVFLMGWLLPHGSIEIPAILLAGQAGLLVAGALIGWGTRIPLKSRLREVGPDLVTLIFGVALLLVWAGIVEAFLSQYHEPLIPYWLKIAFGMTELTLLAAFLALAGRKTEIEGEDVL